MDWESDILEAAAGARQREQHVWEVGYVRITPSVIDAIVPFSPLMEIGAGTGALSAAINAAGGRVVATDAFKSHGRNGWWGKNGRVFRVDANRATQLASRTRSVNLLCSWPSYGERWCFDAVKQLPIGRIFVLIGEGRGGCTGDDLLFDLLEQDFDLIGEHPVEQYPGIHDDITIWKRQAR